MSVTETESYISYAQNRMYWSMSDTKVRQRGADCSTIGLVFQLQATSSMTDAGLEVLIKSYKQQNDDEEYFANNTHVGL